MKYQVTVLTPTLVGDGNRLSPIDYMVWRDQVNVLNQPRIFKLLSKGPRLEGYLSQLQKATKLDFASWGGFAQNFADRRIPFEDPAYTPYFNSAPVESLSIPTFAASVAGPFIPGTAIKGALRTAFVFSKLKPTAVRDLAEKMVGERLPRRPAEEIERQTVGSGGSDRLRAVSIADSVGQSRETFKVYLLRVSTLIARGTNQYSLGWKQAGRGSVDGKRAEDATPTFAEMASPGTSFEGEWHENAFLNREEIRQVLRWSQPVTYTTLFDAANQYAAKQLELHAQYAQWAGLEGLGASLAELRERLDNARNNGACLLAVGWGAGFLSKSAAIGADDADYRKILAMLPYYSRAVQSGLPFPKTRRVVFLKNKPATLPGWVELRVTE
ncbi:MAG: CRISPR-associated protein Csm5 [Bryobacterales bacterium]|jgi:CRISPR-associated protein Csm5|nr:CRISPR-associated protein Csm5 [Bryobacterales bacterium]